MELDNSMPDLTIRIRQYLPYVKRHAVKDNFANWCQLSYCFLWVVTKCSLVDAYISGETAVPSMPHAGGSRFLWNAGLHELVTSQKTAVFAYLRRGTSHVQSYIYSSFLHHEITTSVFNTVTYRCNLGANVTRNFQNWFCLLCRDCLSYIYWTWL